MATAAGVTLPELESESQTASPRSHTLIVRLPMVIGSLAGGCARIGQSCATPLPLPGVAVTQPMVNTLSPGNRSPSATNSTAATFGLSASDCRLRCTTIAPCK